MISEVGINYTEPVKGQTPDTVPQIPVNAPYTLESFTWYESDGTELSDTDTFEPGVYDVLFMLKPKAGYAFSEDLTLEINGKTVSGWAISGTNLFFTTSYGVDMTVINSVEVSYAEPEGGQTPPTVTLKNPELYEDIFLVFYDYEADDYMKPDDLFRLGDAFAIDVELTPKEGYAFGSNVTFTVNGEDCDCYCDVESDRFYAYHDFKLLYVIDTVEVSFTEPKVGETVPEITLKNPELYENPDIYFYDWDFKGDCMSAPGDVFRTGGEYGLFINLSAAEHCVFAENVTLIINGKSFTDGDDEVYFSSDNDESWFYSEYYFDTFITVDTVEISFAEPKVGDEVPEITFKNPEHFSDDPYTDWYSTELPASVTAFPTGGEYELFIDLYTADGYVFAEEVTFIVNGKVINEEQSYYSDTNIGFYYTLQLVDHRTVISAVDFPAWPSFKVGDPIPDPVVPTDSSEPFFLASRVVVYDPLQISMGNPDSFFPASGVFEEGKVYRMEYVAMAGRDYRFVPGTTKVTQNNQSVTPEVFEHDHLLLQKYYNFSDQTLLDTVDLLLTEPALGEKPSDVTAADDAPYSVESYDWGITYDPSSFMVQDVTDRFPTGYPILTVTVNAGEGVLFTNNMKFTVNGKPATVTVVSAGSTQQEIKILFDELKPLPIPAIDFPAWPELEVGDSCDFINDLMLIPTPGMPSPYGIMASLTDADGNSVPSSAKLESGKTYRLILMALCADEVYAFTDATKVTQDGKAPTGRISPETLGLPPMFRNRIILLEKYYNFDEDVTVLDWVDINIDQPEIGKEPGSITLPADSPFRLEETMWGSTPDGDFTNTEIKDGAWEEGEYPVLGIQVTMPENVILAVSAKVYVNGKLQENVSIHAIDDGTAVLVTLDKLEAEQPDDGNQGGNSGNEGGTGDGNQGNTPSGGGGQSPSTGDMSNLSAHVTVMMMALCGLCYLLLVVRKRINA